MATAMAMQLSEARRLRNEAERCFRLAQGIAGVQLADELEAIGAALEREAALIERGGRGSGERHEA
jgi:hypothetical protein